jgi:hypothetical protein
MPDSNTFSQKPIAALLQRWLSSGMVIVDPFARNSLWGTVTNDLNPETKASSHLPADEFISSLNGTRADAVLFDPPYSPRQIAECYQQIGRPCGREDTQNARLYKTVKQGLNHILKLEGIAICCGWNSLGMGLSNNFEMLEILLVTHGGAHNDTIVTVERKSSQGQL